jgi:hypothetical protein
MIYRIGDILRYTFAPNRNRSLRAVQERAKVHHHLVVGFHTEENGDYYEMIHLETGEKVDWHAILIDKNTRFVKVQ